MRNEALQFVVFLQGRAGGAGFEFRAVGGAGVEHIATTAERNLRLALADLEMIVAFLDLPPELHVRIKPVLGQVLGGHAERHGLHLDRALAAGERFAGDGVDLRHLLVGHRETARRRAGAVNHDRAAGIALRLVERVGIADVERQIELRVRVHLPRRDRVEAFRNLPVAFALLGAKLAGPAAHRIGFEMRISPVGAHFPDFELRFLLVGADKHRGLFGGAFLLHQADRLRGNRDQRASAGQRGRVLTARQAEGCGKRQRRCAQLPRIIPIRRYGHRKHRPHGTA